MDIFYLINGKKYLDNYQLRQRLQLNKSEIQKIMDCYPFPGNEVVKIQNKKLYSLNGLNEYLEMILEKK
jgi:hypothetical protein